MLGPLGMLLDEKTFESNSWTLLFVGVIITLRIISASQKERIRLYYKKSSDLMKAFLQQTPVRDYTYTPYFLTLNQHWQAVFYLLAEIANRYINPMKFEREMFQLSDGGTIALDWVVDHEGGLPRKHSQRPVLCCISGLSGGNDNLYLASIVKAAQQSGFKCVIINFRGAAGVLLTSPLIYWLNTWRDVQEPIEYVHAKYCGHGDGDYMKRNIYAYAVSLGAGMLTKYVVETGDKCVLDGVLSYGLFFNIQDNVPFFKRHTLSLYDKALGLNYYTILKGQEKDFKAHFGEEKTAELLDKLNKYKWSLMDISEQVLAPMFGFTNLNDYYDATQTVGQLHKIKVPTFFLNTLDDPTIDPCLYPYKELENNDFIVSAFTKRGGHCGHFTGGFRPYQWFTAPYMDFLEFLEARKNNAAAVNGPNSQSE